MLINQFARNDIYLFTAIMSVSLKSFAGWKLYGMAENADDTDKLARQADYFTEHWYRQQHAHAYTLGGVVLGVQTHHAD